LLAASRSRQQALLVKAHGLLDDKPEDGATGQPSHAAGIKPSKLFSRELDRKRVS
jgi:hypothetical protein